MFAAEPDLKRVAIVDGLRKAQIVDTVVGEDRPEIGIDKKARRKGHDEISMSDPAVEKRIPGRSLFVCVCVKFVTSELSEMLNIVQRDFPRLRYQGVTKLQLFECFSKRVHAGVVLIGTFDPAMADGRQCLRRSLNGRSLHVMQYTANTAHFLATTGTPGTTMNEMRQWGAVAC